MFCGSNPGADPAFTATAMELGRAIATARHGLVYGGGRVGLMGVVADAALAAGGEVLGFMPQAALRVTNLYRPALRHYAVSIAFKPRYRLDAAGELTRVPCPVQRLSEVPGLFESQERFLGIETAAKARQVPGAADHTVTRQHNR